MRDVLASDDDPADPLAHGLRPLEVAGRAAVLGVPPTPRDQGPGAEPDTGELVAEVLRLRHELRAERTRRIRAESLGERAGADLSDPVRELRTVQSELLDRVDQARVTEELGRALRQDLDSAQVVNRAAESVGQATGVDRCDVLLVDAERFCAVRGSWSSGPVAARLPRPDSFVDLPEALVSLLVEAAQQLEPLRIDHVGDDPRLDPDAAATVLQALGVRALLAVPVAVGDEVVGWLLLSSVAARPWHPHEVQICQSISHDLVFSLVGIQAFEQQRESMRRLEELDHAKDAFVSLVSHELRTPLTSIVGYLELMTEGGMGELDEEVRQGLDIIGRNVDRLRNLVEDLLALSAYDAEQVQLDLRPVDLLSVVGDCRQLLAPLTAERQLELDVVSAHGLPRVVLDRRQFDRALLNLLSNAVKFSHRGGTVTVELEATAQEVLVHVVDEGIGIPAAEQARLFSRFFRSSLSVAEEIQGTGLGLALARSVVEWHGGTIGLTSVEGAGTRVTVHLPRHRDLLPEQTLGR